MAETTARQPRPHRRSTSSSSIRKPGAHLERGRRPRRLRADARRRPRELPEVPDGSTTPSPIPKTELDIRQELDVDSGAELRRLQRAVPGRPPLHRLLDRGARRRSSCRGARRTCSSASTAGSPRCRAATAPTTAAEIEWAAWNDQIVPELERMRTEFLPAGTAYDDPNQHVAEADRATTRVVYTGLFTPGPTPPSSPSPSWSPGSSAATSTCCSASRAGPRRSSCATALDEMFDIQFTLWGDDGAARARRS